MLNIEINGTVLQVKLNNNSSAQAIKELIYYAPNTWNFTRLGKIQNKTEKELKKILGKGNITATLSLPAPEGKH